MNRPNFDQVKFFVGNEVEHTPSHGKRTLFVVDVQSIQEIQDWIDDFDARNQPIEHIYFGANQSFPQIQVNDFKVWSQWEHMIGYFLDLGFLCTLDIDVSCVEGLVESGLSEHDNFVPMISVKLPYVQLLGYNATIKLDDRDFESTNPGVWCHSLHELQTRSTFTSWREYKNDKEVQ